MQLSVPKTIILANGQFPLTDVPLAALSAAERIVCCDGAVDKLMQSELEPTWIVGDMDSLSSEARCRYSDRLVYVAEQQTNDLTKAFKFCLSHGWRELLILGASGLREDHTLSNLSLLVDFASEAKVLMLTDTGWFTPIKVSTRLAAYTGQPVSIFSFDPSVVVYAEGLKYPLENVHFTRWWHAALNMSCGDDFKLVFEGGPLLVFQAYTPGYITICAV